MSPKTSTTAIVSLVIALLSLTFTVPQSLAKLECDHYNTVKDVLVEVGIRGGFFPDNYDGFSCDYIGTGRNRGVNLTIALLGACKENVQEKGITYTVTYGPLVTAQVYPRLLTSVKGVFVSLKADPSSPSSPLDLELTPDEVQFTPPMGNAEFVKFSDSNSGKFSKSLPIAVIPEEPQACIPLKPSQAALHAHQAEDKKHYPNDNQQGTPNDNYGGRLLRPAGLLLLN